MAREFRTGTDWDRKFYAPRSDEPLRASAVISRGNVGIIVPPGGNADAVAALITCLDERVRNPFLKPGQRRDSSCTPRAQPVQSEPKCRHGYGTEAPCPYCGPGGM